MMLALHAAADALLLAGLAYLGVVLSRIVTAGASSFDDGPPPGRPAIGALTGCAALAGLLLGARGAALPELAIAGMLAVALAGICYADIRYGIVPDVFTFGPLAAVIAGDVLLRQWSPLVAVVLVAAPFGLAALASRGRGMGWGDVKLVALGAAVLGAQPALVAFTAACFVAVAVAVVRRRHGAPIAFAPYLAAGVAAVAALHGIV